MNPHQPPSGGGPQQPAVEFPVGLRVLVVDDDPTCLKIVQHMLNKCRYQGNSILLAFDLGQHDFAWYEWGLSSIYKILVFVVVVVVVTTCSRAVMALDILREKKGGFDIVLSDVYMPDMDGFKLLEHIGLEMDLPVISKQ